MYVDDEVAAVVRGERGSLTIVFVASSTTE
jgi:hypothetical protein